MMADFYKGKRVLLTGHTGFKGSWMCRLLDNLGAEVYGYSLPAPTDPNLYEIADIGKNVTSEVGDIRDFDRLCKFYEDASPDIVIHMAAQPIVKEGYRIPRETFEINVMGTVNLLECTRLIGKAKSIVNVTTDKVYYNDESGVPLREDMKLEGFDPYSNSKSCSDIITRSYDNSFFKDGPAVSVARAGNVIGGGDFSMNRIVPDCVRAVISGNPIGIRNPNSVRPFEHVIEPLYAYLLIAEEQYKNPSLSGAYNIGPDESDCISAGELAKLFCEAWGPGATCKIENDNGPHEAGFLRLDNSLIKKVFGLHPAMNVKDAIGLTVEWTKVWQAGGDTAECMDKQIINYLRKRNQNV